MSEWQPIETAPKDGARILLWDKARDMAISGIWHIDSGIDTPNSYEPPWSWWISDDDLIIWDEGNAPTHWMPLPDLPK